MGWGRRNAWSVGWRQMLLKEASVGARSTEENEQELPGVSDLGEGSFPGNWIKKEPRS